MSVEHLLSPFTRLDAAVDDFLLACESERRAPKTLTAYRHALRRLVAFAGDLPPDRIDAALLRRWQRSLAVEGLSATTQANYLRPVKTWLRWLADENVYGVDAAILDRVKPPRLDTEQPHPFTEAEIARLFAACRAGGWMGQRMRAMIAVLLDTGVRASELVGLRIADVDLTNGSITVRAETSKTRKARTIVLGRRAKAEAGRWWFKQREAWDRRPEAPFFCGRTQRAMCQEDLTRRMANHGRTAGVSGCHPHRFRHTFAVMALRAGMSPSALMATLGHTSFAMTQRYIHLVEADVSIEKRAKSPLDQLRLR